MPEEPPRYKRRWRYYRTQSGASPVEKFLDDLSREDAAAVLVAMEEVRREGNRLAHKLRGDIYEVRARGKDSIFRILYAEEGRHQQVLLALEGFAKKTQKVPQQVVGVAEQRLADWRQRGHQAR